MRRTAPLIAVLVSLLAPAAAHASSIAFVRDGNVWLANPDGSGQQQVTRDGSAASPYHGVSQADDGTLIAARGTRLLRLGRNGELLVAFETRAHDASLGRMEPKQPFEPALSPNGALVAYFVLTSCQQFGSAFTFACSRTQYSASSSFSDPATLSDRDTTNDRDHPAWVGNGRVLLFGPPSVSFQDPGNATQPPAVWFTDPELKNLVEGELTAAADKLAVVRGNNSETIRLYATGGPPPAGTVTPCADLVRPTGRFRDPSWSPDGSSLAWAEDDGIWVLQGMSSAAAPPRLPPGGRRR